MLAPRISRMPQHPRAGLRLMHVHAHPDDESSKGAATTAKYVARGRRRPRRHLHRRRARLDPQPEDGPPRHRWPTSPRSAAQEMERARDILGVRQDWLGFVDSGWPEGDPKPPLPEGCFALVPLEEAAAPLVRLIREFRPHVVTTYDERGGYPHPDHIRCHEVSRRGVRGGRRPGALPRRWASRGSRSSSTTTTPSTGPRTRRSTRRCSPTASSRRTPSGSRSGSANPEWDARITTRVPCCGLLRGARPGAARPRHPDRPRRPLVRDPARDPADRSGRPRTTSWSTSHVDVAGCPRTTCSRASRPAPDGHWSHAHLLSRPA